MHPHLAQNLTAARIGDWQERAAQARLAKEARRGRHLRRGRRGWGAWRTRLPVTTGLASPDSGPTPPAPRVAAPRSGAAGREPVTAGDRESVAAAGDRELAAAGEHPPMTAGAGQLAADERQPAGPRAA